MNPLVLPIPGQVWRPTQPQRFNVAGQITAAVLRIRQCELCITLPSTVDATT